MAQTGESLVRGRKLLVQIILLFLAFTLLIALVAYGPQLLIQWDIDKGWLEPEAANKAINEYRKTVLQLVGGLIIALGLYFTWRRIRSMEKTVYVTEQGQITDRFSKAVEQLGDENMAIRLGGIYALERIARDSKEDHWTVMEVLSAFVRENSPVTGAEEEETKRISTDIQAIMTVIGRRKTEYDHDADRIDLSRTNLYGVRLLVANLSEADLIEVNLSEADLSGADLSGADLGGANLYGAVLSHARLINADLSGASLRHARLNKTALSKFFSGADFSRADLSGADLSGTDLSGADLTTTNLSGADLTGADLTLVRTSATDLTDVVLSLEQLKWVGSYDKATRDPELRKQLEAETTTDQEE